MKAVDLFQRCKLLVAEFLGLQTAAHANTQPRLSSIDSPVSNVIALRANGSALLNTKPACPKTPTVRVIREREPGMPQACAGRMVMSGRFADVCEELNRMAA